MKAYHHPRFRKALLSFLLIALIVSIQFQGMTPVDSAPEEAREQTLLDRKADKHLTTTFQQALTAFGAAKALNAAISLMQETSVRVSPFGVGLDLAVGQVLDPINDMAERASWIFLAAMASVGIQKFILSMVPWASVNVLLCLGLAVLALGFWRAKIGSFNLLTLGTKLILVAILLRLLIPASVVVYEFINVRFTPAHYAKSLADIESAGSDLKSLQQAMIMQNKTAGEPSAWDRAMEWKRVIKEEFSRTVEQAEQTMERFINLIILFIIRTVVLPLGTLWFMLASVKWIVNRPKPFGFEDAFARKLGA